MTLTPADRRCWRESVSSPDADGLPNDLDDGHDPLVVTRVGSTDVLVRQLVDDLPSRVPVEPLDDLARG